MKPIILLDWDGPISNTRTWGMPHNIDPVAVKLLNDLYHLGMQTVLTSTIRKHFETLYDANRFMLMRGIHINWWSPSSVYWRTDPIFTTRRHMEFVKWYNEQTFDEHQEFLALDDEPYPDNIKRTCKVHQFGHTSSHDGMNYLALRETIHYAFQACKSGSDN